MNASGSPAAPRGLIIAAPASGCGKTLVTLGLLRHLYNDGISVGSAKVGPDYIDPAFHEAAAKRPCFNLDTWAMRSATLTSLLSTLGNSSDLIICEGVMGLFDGAATEPGPNDGSTAALARATGWPVVLVVDAAKQASSAAATVTGFAEFDADVSVAGVLFNRVGAGRHAEILRDACRRALPEVKILGCLPRADGLVLPERHLGLIQAVEHPDLDGTLERAAQWIGENVDLSAMRDLARPALGNDDVEGPPALPPLGQRIAIARDAAFAFAYPHVLDGWRDAGAEVMPFSPLAGEAPDGAADAVYLPGGYPELHAGILATTLPGHLQAAAKRGAVIFGECGGYMVLGDGMVDADGTRHAMAGLLPVETSFADKSLHLGYRRAEVLSDAPIGGAGTFLRGHEFHYATVVREDKGEALFGVSDAGGRDLGTVGRRDGSVMGSFMHLIDHEAA